MTELATLASRCTAPSTIHIMYAVENTVVQTALNRKSIRLLGSSHQHLTIRLLHGEGLRTESDTSDWAMYDVHSPH